LKKIDLDVASKDNTSCYQIKNLIEQSFVDSLLNGRMVMPKVLIVEDDQDNRELLSKFLKREGYEILGAVNGEEALQLVSRADLVLLDVMMPKLCGWDVVKRVREDYPRLPVLMLSALATTDDQVRGLELGADDYVTKPYDLRALGSRIKALLRRTGTIENALEFADLRIVSETREVFVKDRRVVLTRVEFELLLTLAQHPSHVFSRERLLERIWGSDYFGMDRVVDVRMVSLRKKLGEDIPYIETVRGLGYRFKVRQVNPTAQKSQLDSLQVVTMQAANTVQLTNTVQFSSTIVP
jgi:two-component system, OmpR family, alkaline phosphatase synthesis response regulator PhoP